MGVLPGRFPVIPARPVANAREAFFADVFAKYFARILAKSA
ncbi:MAG TPA: hypothetical protein VMT31_01695 [Methanomicrobiales archaeon]|nr:hypothetical protein [Methanomicrobiales archaeon]